MKDYLVRVMSKDGGVRALACLTTNLVGEACGLHGTCPTASAALGRALSGGVLMGGLLDDDQRVALKFEGNGPMQKILVEADSYGNVRGYPGVAAVRLPPNAEGKLDVAAAIGKAGFLTVTKDLRLREPYSGVVQLFTSEIAEDLAFYLTDSEQIPSAVGLGVFVEPSGRVASAGGFMIQSMPGAEDAVVDALVDRIAEMPPVSQLLKEGALPEDLIRHIFGHIGYELLETKELFFKCSCSRERMERALISLGKDEVNKIVADEEVVEIVCDFCSQKYAFNRDDLRRVLEEMQ